MPRAIAMANARLGLFLEGLSPLTVPPISSMTTSQRSQFAPTDRSFLIQTSRILHTPVIPILYRRLVVTGYLHEQDHGRSYAKCGSVKLTINPGGKYEPSHHQD
jgi:hypothetical protein